MPTFSVVVEVTETRAYSVYAASQVEAEAAVREEYQVMDHDVLEESLDSVFEVEEMD